MNVFKKVSLVSVSLLFAATANATLIDFQSGSQATGAFSNFTQFGVVVTQLDDSSPWNPEVNFNGNLGLHLDNGWVSVGFLDGSTFDVVDFDWNFIGDPNGMSYRNNRGETYLSSALDLSAELSNSFWQGINSFEVNYLFGGTGGWFESEIRSFDLVSSQIGTIDPNGSVPVPGTMALIPLAIVGLVATRRKKIVA